MEKTGFVRDYIIKNVKNDGKEIILSVTSNYIRNSQEQVIGFEGVVEDITAHYNLECEAEMLRTTVQQTADHVMITDTAGKILYVNQAFQETTGYSREEILLKNPKVLQSGKHGKEYYERLWSTILAGKVFYAQTTNKNKNGQLYIADQSITPIKDKDGHITHFVSVWKDVTEKIHLQEKLRREKAKLTEIITMDRNISVMGAADAYNAVAGQIAGVLDAGRVLCLAVDGKNNRLVLKAQRGYPDEYDENFSVPFADKFAGSVALSEIAMHVENVNDHPHLKNAALPGYLGTSFIIAPLAFEGETTGVVVVTGKQGEGSLSAEFDNVDYRMLALMCKQAAVGLKNAESYSALAELTVTDPMTHIHNF